MKTLLRDTRVQRLLLANITGSVGSGVTIIAVPWLLIHRAGGDQLYGWTTLGTTLALFLLMPYYGAWLDRHSRKTMLLVGEAFGFLATLSMGLWALFSGEAAAWQLITSYFCGMLYYTLHYPAKYAFLQQIFARDQYQPLMGLMEIQGQTAMMIAGGLASVLVDHVSLSTILLLDAGTYLFSFCIQSTLPYEATHLREGSTAGVSASLAEAIAWLRTHRHLTVFFACTLMPFILVMVANYLFPIYVSTVLQADAAVFGRGEIVFALGAMLAGALMPPLATRFGSARAILIGSAFCLASLVLVVALPQKPAYYLALLLYGLGNAGTRVARSALMFHLVPNVVMGRVGMFFGIFDRLVRTLLTFVMTLTIARATAVLGFAILLFVLLAAFVGALLTRTSVHPPSSP